MEIENEDRAEELSFEDAFQKLQWVVETLEKQPSDLAQSLELYRTGKRLSVICTQYLQNAKLRIIEINELEAVQND